MDEGVIKENTKCVEPC